MVARTQAAPVVTKRWMSALNSRVPDVSPMSLRCEGTHADGDVAASSFRDQHKRRGELGVGREHGLDSSDGELRIDVARAQIQQPHERLQSGTSAVTTMSCWTAAAAYASACSTSSAVSWGCLRMISSRVAPEANHSRMIATLMRVPRMIGL